MGARLGEFLRVIGSALDPATARANQAAFMQEEADIAAGERQKVSNTRENDMFLAKSLMDKTSLFQASLQKMPKEKRAKAIQDFSAYSKGVTDQIKDPQIGGALKSSVGDGWMEYGIEEKKKGKHFPAITPEGKRVAAIQDEQGRIIDATTGEHQPTWIEAPKRQETAGAGGFTNKTASDIQGQQLKILQGKDRIKTVIAGFKPEFTEVGTKASAKFTSVIEKFGFKPSKASKKELKEFTTFARNTIGNLNQHIRDRTGAVMNAAEIPRMMGEVPVIGDGIFDGDSSTQFMSKAKGLLEYYDAAEARLAYVTANGLTPDRSERGKDGNWKAVSSSGFSLDEFKDLPPAPANVNTGLWDKMSPSDRREYVSLLNAQGKQ